MKILQINSHHKLIGGTERCYLELSDLLRKKGHQVANFSLLDSKNYPSKWEKYFLGELNFGKNDYKSFIKKVSRMFYSLEAKKKINLILDDFGPDIVHIHNIYYYISPSILTEIKKRGIPIIQTVHDYQLISPNVNFFHDGKICEVTKTNKFYKAVFHKCVKSSYLASLMAAIASYIQHIFRLYERHVEYFITPSKFMGKKLIEYGFDPKKIIHLPNFTKFSPSLTPKRQSKEKYVLYFGRLDEQKGVMFLLEVAKNLPQVKFRMIGKYPDEKTKIKIKSFLSKHSIKNVTMSKHQETGRLQQSIAGSLFVVVPSLWLENMPNTVLESYAFGKPVVASDIGGIPEIVKDKKTGLLFNPGDSNDLAGKIRLLWNNPELAGKLGREGLKTVKNKFNPEVHYKKIMTIYNHLAR